MELRARTPSQRWSQKQAAHELSWRCRDSRVGVSSRGPVDLALHLYAVLSCPWMCHVLPHWHFFNARNVRKAPMPRLMRCEKTERCGSPERHCRKAKVSNLSGEYLNILLLLVLYTLQADRLSKLEANQPYMCAWSSKVAHDLRADSALACGAFPDRPVASIFFHLFGKQHQTTVLQTDLKPPELNG